MIYQKLKIKIAMLVNQNSTAVIEVLSNPSEIHYLETNSKELSRSLQDIHLLRLQKTHQEEELADYIEQLILNPMLHTDIKQQGIEWFYSKIQLEQFREKETQALELIAQHAFKIFLSNTKKKNFHVYSHQHKLNVLVYHL